MIGLVTPLILGVFTVLIFDRFLISFLISFFRKMG